MKKIFQISRYKLLVLLLLVVFVFTNQTTVFQNKDSTSTYKKGMVVTANPIASNIGVEVLKKGGNAVDAAVAVSFALAVCHPSAGNLGGGGFMVFRFSDGTNAALDFRETAPQKAHKNLFLDSTGNVIKGLSNNSTLAAGIPGSVDGIITAHTKYGTLPFADLIQPAIELATKGFPLTEMQANALNNLKDEFKTRNRKPVAFVKDKTWQKGDTLKQPDLAMTLTLIRDNGRDGFYKGKIANLIVSEMRYTKGIITHRDLDEYFSKWRKPIVGHYKGYKIITMPPSSSGGIALMQMLKMIEPFPLQKYGFQSAKAVHLMTEVQRRAFADRAKYLGDADFYPVPVADLLDSNYLAKRMANFDENLATKSADIKYTIKVPYESAETTHFSIVDANQNSVSCTTTLNSSFGSKIVVSGAGFILNDEMDDFSSKEGTTNQFHLLQSRGNLVEPNKRPLSSMTPTIIEKNNKLFMAVGSPGGPNIITSVFETIVNVIEFNMTMQQAVDARRFHNQWFPDQIDYETSAFNDKLIKELKAKGHTLNPVSTFGRVDAVLIFADSTMQGGADPRGNDAAAGF